MARRGVRADLTPGVRAPRVRLLSLSGLAFIATRAAYRYLTATTARDGLDNATFLYAATQDYRRRPYERLSGPKWQRLTRRWVLVGIPAMLLLAACLAAAVARSWTAVGAIAPGWTAWPWLSLLMAYACLSLASGGALATVQVVVWWRTRQTQRDYVMPTARVVSHVLSVKFTKRAARGMVCLPPGFPESFTDPVRIWLPNQAIDEGTEKRLAVQAGAKLGMPDPLSQWQRTGSRPYVDLMPNTGPPETVTFSDVRRYLDGAPMAGPFVGLARSAVATFADFDNDSPHTFASGGTGTGKSTLYRTLFAQRLRHGSFLVVLDFKSTSHRWARDLPGDMVIYLDEVADIHDACIAIGQELEHRKRAYRDDPSIELRTLDVLVEESNSLLPMLNDYWTEIREPDQSKKSPAVAALGYLINMGREFRMHAHYAAQRASSDAFGGRGADRRENFQIRFMAKPTVQTWKMLAPQHPFQRTPAGPRGMWFVVTSDEVTLVRVPNLSDADAVAWATGGTQTMLAPFLSGVLPTRRVPVIDGEVTPALAAPEPVTLREFAQAYGLSLDAVRKRAQGLDFPAPVRGGGSGQTGYYPLADLETYFRLSSSYQDEDASTRANATCEPRSQP